MRFVVGEPGPEWDGENDEYMAGRLRTRYVALVAATVALLLATFHSSATAVVGATMNLIWDHYPWALFVPVAVLTGWALHHYLTWTLLLPYESAALIPVCATAGLVVGAAVAITWDGNWSILPTALAAFPGGWVGLSIATIAWLLLAAWLRSQDLRYIDWVEVGLGLIAATVVIPAGYVLVKLVVVRVPWHEFGSTAWHGLRGQWAPSILVILLLIQAPYWRRVLTDRSRRSPDADSENAVERVNMFMLLLAIAAIGIAAYVVLYHLPESIVGGQDLTPRERSNALTQERRTLLATLGAVGAGVTLIYTHLRHQLERDSNATGRYTEAVQQLGNEAMSIRLGGIYALTRVARDSPGDRQTVIEVLAAFVRDSTRALPNGVALDVSAALAELGKMSVSDDFYSERVNLTSSHLVEGNLESVKFPTRVDLRHSDLSGTSLRNCTLEGAELRDATLSDTSFVDASMPRADLSDVTAYRADFKGADLANATLARANLTEARLVGTHLTDANLERANLQGADMSGANLTGANLKGANLLGANLSGSYLALAILTEATYTPNQFASAQDAESIVLQDLESDPAAWEAHQRKRREYGL